MLIKLSMYSLFVLFLLSIIHCNPLPQECYDSLVQSPACSWYPQCLQQKFHCGNNGYPIGYGYKYCNRFVTLKTFPKARHWVQLTVICLKQKLLSLLKQEVTMTCHELKKVAFESHPICYDQSGFCHLFSQLGFEDSVVFSNQLLGIFDLKDFQSVEAVKQVEQMVVKCFKQIFPKSGKFSLKKQQ